MSTNEDGKETGRQSYVMDGRQQILVQEFYASEESLLEDQNEEKLFEWANNVDAYTYRPNIFAQIWHMTHGIVQEKIIKRTNWSSPFRSVRFSAK